MEVIDLKCEGLKLIRPAVFHDERGFFLEWYRKSFYEQRGIDVDFAQDNHSYSKKGTLRGMHFQRFPGQAKLVTVLQGAILDVAVDIRRDSPTFGRWESVLLDAATHEQLFIPVGFAHGFCVISDTAHVLYKVSSEYNVQEEKAFRFDDPEIGIAWPQLNLDFTVSEKDLRAPLFREMVL